MYCLTIYRMPKSGRWRWKFSYGNRVLARADYHYDSFSACKKVFGKFVKVVSLGPTAYSETRDNG